MTRRKFEWENKFPPNCPLHNAKQSNLEDIYRLVPQSRLQENYFYPIKNHYINHLDPCVKESACFLENFDDAENVKNTIPAYKNFHIAEGYIKYSDGVYIFTDELINFWRYEGIQIHMHFRVR
ncbi:TPA: hypothetical protein OZL71_001256 [Legionella pneumophila]|nr:hypothetical protein [Legionella pneumophila]